MKCTIVSFLVLIVSISVSGQDGLSSQNLSQAVTADILSMMVHGLVNSTGNCTDFANDTVQFWFYTDELDQVLLDPEDPSLIDPSQPLSIAIHGWISSANASYIQAIKDAYLQNIENMQVILMDWSTLAAQDYFTAYCNLPKVAATLEALLCTLNDDFDFDLSTVHLIGHSLGAQTAGLAGHSAQQHCGSIGRITGLDPAGPLFQGLPDDQRLTKDDADFVEVIHTNSGLAGYVGECGSVDFYPNCGSVQPGCSNSSNLMNALTTGDISQLPGISDIFCDHIRSCQYFAESIGKSKFVGTSCSTCPLPCANDLLRPETLLMGQYTPTTFDKTNYLLMTKAEYPFAK